MARAQPHSLLNLASGRLQLSARLRADGLKERIAWQLERIEQAASRKMARGTGVLATIGSTAPFVGLFGTVWGIMDSFIGISKAHTTNLAVVAPGIAEALLATALGLVAAIPAVMIYNMLARSTAHYRALLGDASALVMALVSRDLERAKQPISEAAEWTYQTSETRLRRNRACGRSLMRLDFYRLALLAAAVCMAAGAAQAHPHVWVTMTEELLYAPDGSVTGVRHTWTFDDMFSAFAVQGLDQETNGTFTREELAPLAKVNVESLKEYAYFTYAKVNGKRQRDAFADPIDYWLAYDPKDTVLTLHFTLPFKTAVKAQALNLEIYDPEFFIDFGFADNELVRLVNAPRRCTAAIEKPRDENFPATLRFDRSLLTSEANKGMGASFSNRISVICP